MWKDVPGYEGLYQVSDIGEVRSLNYRGTGKARQLKPASTPAGYLLVTLYRNGVTKSHTVHKLVMLAFVGKRPVTYVLNPSLTDKPIRTYQMRAIPLDINHIDGNKSNNRLENLEYITPNQNIKHAIRLRKRLQ